MFMAVCYCFWEVQVLWVWRCEACTGFMLTLFACHGHFEELRAFETMELCKSLYNY